MYILKKIFLASFFLFLASKVQAQVNLVRNPSFEQLDACPSGYFQADTAMYWDWINHTTLPPGNACRGILYSMCCTNPPYCSVPYNDMFQYQKPRTGNSYIGLAPLEAFPPTINNNKRHYLKGQLNSTLQVGKNYCLTIYYNTANYIIYSTNRFGAYIDDGTVASYNCCKEMPVTPQAQNNPLVFMTDTANWVKIQGSFTAIGNENTITLGNFVDSATIQFQLFNSSGLRIPFYGIDDVSLIPIDLAPNAGKDSSITLGDSAYIGRTSEVGLNDDCIWYLQGNVTPFDTVAGLWVKPNTLGTHNYVVEQNICGTITYDTVVVTVNPVGIEQFQNIKSLKIFPNPTTGDIFITGTVVTEASLKVELYDVSGRLLLQKTIVVQNGIVKLNTELNNGVYQLRFISSDGTVRQQKIIITK